MNCDATLLIAIFVRFMQDFAKAQTMLPRLQGLFSYEFVKVCYMDALQVFIPLSEL